MKDKHLTKRRQFGDERRILSVMKSIKKAIELCFVALGTLCHGL